MPTISSAASASPAAPQGAAGTTLRRRDLALVLAAGLLVRLWIIYRYPMVFGDDTIARLAHPDNIVLGHNLPLLQLVIHYAHAIAAGPLLVRYFMAAVGAVAGAGCYLLLSDLVPASLALDGALLFVASPFVLAESVVPYEEILMLAGLLFAFHFAFTERWTLASLSLGVACLTRYESWLACPVLAVAYLRTSGVTPRTLLAAGALFGWAPLAWIVYNRGLSPPGTYALEWPAEPERLLRLAHLGWATVRFTPLPAALLAAWGVVLFFRQRLFARPKYQLLGMFLGFFVVALLFSAYGVGPDPARTVTVREAHIFLVGAVVLATLGLSTLPFQHVITALSVVVGLWMANRFVARATSEPHLALSYRVAQFVDRDVPPNEPVVVLARGTDAEPYLAHMEREHGPLAVRRDLEMLRTLHASRPADYQRIAAHAHSAGRLVSYATLHLGRFADTTTAPPDSVPPAARPRWFVLWSDFVPTNAVEAGLAAEARAGVLHETFRRDSLWVRLYTVAP